MSTSTLATVVIAVCLVGFIVYRQMGQRLVSQRGLLLPALLGILLGGIFVTTNPTGEADVAVAVGAAFGVLSGLVSGQFMLVWRNERTGWVYQKGSWRYLIAVLVLVVIRVAARFALQATGYAIDEVALNDAFIAALVGNYLGRAIRIALRALPLVGGSLGNLPVRS
jgi:hypothetical protein